MLKMKRCKDATAEGLFTALIAELAKSKISESQMVGFSADTCNTMFGEHNSVSQKLRALIPHLLTVKCSCQSLDFDDVTTLTVIVHTCALQRHLQCFQH